MKAFYWVLLSFLLLTACSQHVDTRTQRVVELYMEEADGLGNTVQMEGSELVYSVSENALLGAGDIIDIDLAQVDMGYCLLLHLSDAGRAHLERSVENDLGKSVILMVDGKPVGARKFKAKGIEDHGLFIFTEWDDARLEDFVVNAKKSFAKSGKMGV